VGVCCGLAVSASHGAFSIAALALVRIVVLARNVRDATIGAFIVTSAIVYVEYNVFFEHIARCQKADADPRPPMPSSIFTALFAPYDPCPSMFRRVVELICFTLTSPRPSPLADSPWWSWPLALGRWVPLWEADGRRVVCMANVLLWCPVFIGALVSLGVLVYTRNWAAPGGALCVGYWLSYLPLAACGPRNLTVYALPLLFGICNLAGLIERAFVGEMRGFVAALAGAMAVAGFFLWAPLAYGLSTPDFGFRVWNPSWLHGLSTPN
jgi:hypothetical protein